MMLFDDVVVDDDDVPDESKLVRSALPATVIQLSCLDIDSISHKICNQLLSLYFKV